MKLCINEATTMPATFAQDVAHFAKAGWAGMEVWLTKLETHLESHSLAETRDLLAQHQITLPAASYQGGLLISQGEQRRTHFDHFKKRLELCEQLRIPTLVLAADFVQTPHGTDLERALVSLAQAAQWAAGFNVHLALEFRGRGTFCSSLDTAAVRMINRPLFFDTFAASIRHRDLSAESSEVEYIYHFTARPRWLRFLLHPLMNAVFALETRKRLRGLKLYFAARCLIGRE